MPIKRKRKERGREATKNIGETRPSRSTITPSSNTPHNNPQLNPQNPVQDSQEENVPQEEAKSSFQRTNIRSTNTTSQRDVQSIGHYGYQSQCLGFAKMVQGLVK